MTRLNPDSKYAKTESAILRRLFRHSLPALASHWTFQSLFYMDSTERRFKITLDLVFTIFGAVLLTIWLPGWISWPAALLIAHSLNFLFNGHFWGVLKHYGFVRHSYPEFSEYVDGIAGRAEGQPAINTVIVYGALSRKEWAPTSDLDARIIRFPGYLNGLRACWFLMGERTRALLAGFPLDMYLLDSDRALRKLEAGERPITLFCRESREFAEPF